MKDETRKQILQNIIDNLEDAMIWSSLLDRETMLKIKNSVSYDGHYGPEGAWVVAKKALDSES